MRDRVAPWIAILAVLGATAFLFAPIVKGAIEGAPRFFEWDVPEQYWPDLVYLCDSLHRGELPYWNPYDRGGYPYYADPQSAQYHPTSWAICALAGPRPSLAWATARVLIGFALSGLFGLLWLRRMGASYAGAIAGAVLIEAAPFMRHNWELNLTGALAYLPLMLWAADRLAMERRSRDGVLLALATALTGWMGSPPALWLASTLTALYFVFRVGVAAREDRAALKAVLVPALVAVLFTVGLLGAVLVPGAHLAEHSVQAGRSFDSIAEDGLAPARLVALVWPQPGNHLYVGWLALVLAMFALGRPRDRSPIFFLSVAVVAVLLAMGAHGPLFRFAFDHVPGVRAFRLPHRYEAWLGPAFGALVALGLSELERRARSISIVARETRARVLAAVLALVGAALVALAPGYAPGLLVLASAALVFASTLEHGLGSAWTGLVLAIVIVVDVSQALPPDRHTREGPPPARDAIASEVLPHVPGTRARWRILDEFALSCRAGTRFHRRDFRGYQDPLMLESYERVIDSLRDHPELAPQFNVRFALTSPHFLHGWDHHYLPLPAELSARLRSRVVFHEEEREVIELLDALPLAYFVPAGEVERAPRGEVLARVKALAPAAIAVLEGTRRVAVQHARRPAAVGCDVRLEADALSFTIDAPSEGVVVVSEVDYRGWRASVDGAEVPIVRANALVRAIPVTPGHHRVRMEFVPSDGRAWRLVLLASLVLAMVVLVGSAAQRRRG